MTPNKERRTEIVYTTSSHHDLSKAKHLFRRVRLCSRVSGPLSERLLAVRTTTASLVGELLRFPRNPTALTLDIEDMFIQVGVSVREKRYLDVPVVLG